MPRIFILLALAFLLLTAFTKGANLDGVIEALRTGNATALAGYVDDSVEIGMPDKTGTYNKAQATALFRDFFASKEVKLFEVKHKGDNEGKQFCVGVLHTKAGSFRTQVFMHTRNGRQAIKLISFQGQ